MRKWKSAFPLLASFATLLLTSPARAADDTPKFLGQWKAAFLYQNVWVTLISIHDSKGYKNYVITHQGAAPAGDGTFSAADGKWTASAAAPNDTGTYEFLDKNTALCKNALDQSLLWQRDNTPLPPILGATPTLNSLPAGTNFAAVRVSQAIDVCRNMAHLWQADAVLVAADIFRPNSDGTVNILANPQAFTITFYSPSANAPLAFVSTPNPGTFAPKPDARPPTDVMRAIPSNFVDLTQAMANERLFGFTGNLQAARMFFVDKNNKPTRLVWSLDVGEAYPRIVSAATGAILSPFEVYDDKVADYNKLAADTAAAVAAMRARSQHRGHSGGGEWLGGGLHFWSGESHGEGAGQGGQGGQGGEEDTWDNEVGAQNAWEAGDSEAEGRFDAGAPTEVDTATYSGGE